MSDKFPVDAAPDTRLLECVVELALQPGDLLPSEAVLAERLHAGRPQVREALRVLEAFGAVRSRQGARRTWVGFGPDAFGTHLAAVLGASRQSVEELFEIRHAFEATHVAQVTARISAEQEEELRVIVRRMVADARAGRQFEEEDEAFHRALFASVDNRVFEGISAAFWRLQGRLESTRAESREELQHVAAMHARILDAVVARDVRLATHELDAHFWGIRRRIHHRDSGAPPD